MTEFGWNALSGILEGAFTAATGIASTVVGGKTEVAQIEANTKNKVDDSDTNRTMIIVGGVVATVLIGIVLYGVFVKKK